MMRGTVPIHYRMRGDTLEAWARCPGGPVVRARVSMSDLARRIDAMRGRARTAQVSGFLSKARRRIKDIAKKIARSKVVKGLGKVASKTLDLAAKIVPSPYNAAFKAAGQVRDLVQRAKRGDKRAIAAIRLAKQRAAAKRRRAAPTLASSWTVRSPQGRTYRVAV